MYAPRRPLRPSVLLCLSVALAGCGWEVPPVEELPPLVLSPDAGTPATPPPPTTPVPTGALPQPPTGVVVTAGDGNVQVSWSAASGNGRPVLSYRVTIRNVSNAAAGTIAWDASASTTTLSYGGLTPGHTYEVSVATTTSAGTGLASTPIRAVPFMGSCATAYNLNAGRAASGIYRLTLGGAQVDAYCEMTTGSGGWTLVLHSAFSAQFPTNSALFQSLGGWRTLGVGQAAGFGGHYGLADYVMPLDAMRALFASGQGGRLLRFQSDSAWNLTALYGTTMGPDFSLRGLNTSEVASRLCGGSTDCFLEGAPAFSTYDSATPGSGCAQQSNGLGGWYRGESCSRHHPFRTDSRALYSGYSSDPYTNHWSWWVQ